MGGFLFRRILASALTLFAVATLCFFVTRLAPGSPFTGDRPLSREAMGNLDRYYGFDRPVLAQYAATMGNYLRGDLGPSYYYRDRTVSQLIGPALRVSAILGVIAFAIALLLGIPLGAAAAAKRNRWPDHLASTVSLAGICIPNFLLGPLLILLFAFVLGWLPVGRWPQDFSPPELRRLVLPAVTLALVHVAYVARLTRAGMLDVLNRDYIRTARSKGLTERSVVFRHALRNGITPVVSCAGPMAAMTVTGSVVVERVFDLPGLGRHFVDSALALDHPRLMGGVLVFSALIIVFNLLVDLAHSWLDPRVRIS